MNDEERGRVIRTCETQLFFPIEAEYESFELEYFIIMIRNWMEETFCFASIGSFVVIRSPSTQDNVSVLFSGVQIQHFVV